MFAKVLLDAVCEGRADSYKTGQITRSDLAAKWEKRVPALPEQSQSPRIFTPASGVEYFVAVSSN